MTCEVDLTLIRESCPLNLLREDWLLVNRFQKDRNPKVRYIRRIILKRYNVFVNPYL